LLEAIPIDVEAPATPAPARPARPRPKAQPAARPPAADEKAFPIKIALMILVPCVIIVGALGIWYLISGTKEPETAQLPPITRPTAVPTATPAPATPTPQPTLSATGTREELLGVIVEAKQAIARDDLDQAQRLLMRATLISSNDPDLIAAARDLTVKLMSRAEEEASREQYQSANALLDQARQLALRFNFSTREIDDQLSNLRQSESGKIVNPSDLGGLRKLIGKKVRVMTKSGEVREGTLRSVSSGQLVLDAQRQVGAGQMAFRDEIKLSEIESVQTN
jgi:hypothetical protein